jgi:ADP-L-glycero-D-manno-heptose 6-epimerase
MACLQTADGGVGTTSAITETRPIRYNLRLIFRGVPMRILVTGGAGFIGSNLAKRLMADGHETVVLDNFFSADFRNLTHFAGEVFASDCTPACPIPGGFDVIFHQASITDTTVHDQFLMMKNNVEGFRNVLGWAAKSKSRVVWASSASIYGNGKAPNAESAPPGPLNVYAFSKLTMERLAARWHRETGLSIVGLRYFNVYGPGETHKGKFASMIYQLAQQMKAGRRPRIFKFGEQKRDFVCVEDVLQANLLAMKATGPAAAGESYNVGSGAPASFNDVVAQLNVVLKTHLEPDYFDNPYSFTQDHTEADLAKSRAGLGYNPQYDLAGGVRHYHESGAL